MFNGTKIGGAFSKIGGAAGGVFSKLFSGVGGVATRAFTGVAGTITNILGKAGTAVAAVRWVKSVPLSERVSGK